jgi:CBS domain-containing protein
MKAMDVMVRDVVTVKPDDSVSEVVKLLAEHDVSAVPVVSADGQVVGMISEADLMRRPEIGTEKHRPRSQARRRARAPRARLPDKGGARLPSRIPIHDVKQRLACLLCARPEPNRRGGRAETRKNGSAYHVFVS